MFYYLNIGYKKVRDSNIIKRGLFSRLAELQLNNQYNKQIGGVAASGIYE
ncbi:hypothetical protein STZ1_20288 [Bacillus subtilis]